MSIEQLTIEPCPCGHPTCKKVLLSPLCTGMDATLLREDAEEVARRYNSHTDLLRAARVAYEVISTHRLAGLDQNPKGVTDLLGAAIGKATGRHAPQECSICRRVHGSEIRHESE